MTTTQPKISNSALLKILLAEDDNDDCLFFSSALEAIDIPTQLAIVKDGVQLMDYLSCNVNQLPIIRFSTSKSKDMIGLVFKNGADVYISKPSDFSELKQVIFPALPIALQNAFSKDSLKYILNA